jgi:hypothetical protein
MLSSETTENDLHAGFDDLHARFDDCGRRWAEKMLGRLRASFLEVPLVWPGTLEQAATIVHALSQDSLSESQRTELTEVVQSGARAAWRDLVRV